MKNRLAKKIVKSVGTDYCPYNQFQIQKANIIWARLKTSKEAELFYDGLMKTIKTCPPVETLLDFALGVDLVHSKLHILSCSTCNTLLRMFKGEYSNCEKDC